MHPIPPTWQCPTLIAPAVLSTCNGNHSTVYIYWSVYKPLGVMCTVVQDFKSPLYKVYTVARTVFLIVLGPTVQTVLKLDLEGHDKVISYIKLYCLRIDLFFLLFLPGSL